MTRTASACVADTLRSASDLLKGFTDISGKMIEFARMHFDCKEGAAILAGAEAHFMGELAVCAGSCGRHYTRSAVCPLANDAALPCCSTVARANSSISLTST